MKGGKAKADTKKSDSRLAVKRKGAEKASKKPAKKAAGKDPNKPKRPPSAFFVFMEEFRKQFQEKNPHNKSVATVGKAGGAKWKSLSEAEKAPYVAKANKRKADFQKAMADYEKKKVVAVASLPKEIAAGLQPKNSNSIRGLLLQSGWLVEKMEDDSCMVTYVVQLDPAGWLPKCFVNRLNTKLVMIIGNLKKMAQAACPRVNDGMT